MKIEERLVCKMGLTNNPIMGLWLLTDGTLINGSFEGHQRDVDHRDIGEYFKKSKEDRTSGSLYMDKFMRRGNIRWGCSDYGLTIEFHKTPTGEQLDKIFTCGDTRQFAVMFHEQWHDFSWFYNYVQQYCRYKGTVFYEI